MKLPIIYHDDVLVAINKPSGLLVHRSSIDKYETRFAVQTLRNQMGRHVYPIHRLDKPTSGVLLFAFEPEIVKKVASEWGNIDKRYLCLVRGNMASITLNNPIKTISESGREKIQDAETDFITVATFQLPVVFGKTSAQFTHTSFSLVEARLKTGRKHQIRKHLKHLNHPIVGDTRYGRGEINRYFREEYDVRRLLLHCQSMTLKHPVSGRNIYLYAKMDSVWLRVLSRFARQFEF